MSNFREIEVGCKRYKARLIPSLTVCEAVEAYAVDTGWDRRSEWETTRVKRLDTLRSICLCLGLLAVEELTEIETTMAILESKIQHGCTDAFCRDCEGPKQ